MPILSLIVAFSHVHQKLVSYEQTIDAYSTSHIDRLVRAEKQATAFLESKQAEVHALDVVVAELHARASEGYARLQQHVTKHTAENVRIDPCVYAQSVYCFCFVFLFCI